MNHQYQTEQEQFWATEFGDTYTARNSDPKSVSHRISLFSKILTRTHQVKSFIEFGSNVGYNLRAIRHLIPDSNLCAIEINQSAIQKLRDIPNINIFEGSVFDFSTEALGIHDFTFTCGVLIHISPMYLKNFYHRLYTCSRRYILINEYYNPTPVEINYRGYSKKLFKRDFAGEMLDQYSELELVDYGFQYYRDHNFPADDTTWFLLRKRG